MWYLLALIPSLLLADVDPATVTDSVITEEKAPALHLTQTPAPTTSSNEVAKDAKPGQVTDFSAPTAQPQGDLVQLHTKPAASSPVVLSVPESEVKASSQDANTAADGMKWYSIERQVTLTGYVDKGAVEKDLAITQGSVVWADPEKKEQLTVVDNPSFVRLLEVDHMGKVEVKEPRVLYYGVTEISTPKTPVVDSKVNSINEISAPVVTSQPVVDETTLKRRGTSVEYINKGNLRTIEGILRKGHSLFGKKLFLDDVNGNLIAKIDKDSRIDWLTFQRYVGQRAIFVGELHENGSELVMTVRSISLR